MNPMFFAAGLEREASSLLQRAGALMGAATAIRSVPAPRNSPTVEMRKHLAGLGFAVVSRDALSIALACMEADVDLPEGETHEGFDKALTAVRDALKECGR